MGQSGLALTHGTGHFPACALASGNQERDKWLFPRGWVYDNLPFSNRLPPAQNDPAGVEPCISVF